MKRTPLFAAHQTLGGRLIEFGGWEMPVQYTSIVDEHHAVRSAAGLFDIAHMGEVRVAGPGAEAFLNRVLTNDVQKLAVGLGQYTLMCNEAGGVIDDLYAYRLESSEFLLIINASRIEEDVRWLKRQWSSLSWAADVQLEDQSDALGALALQGPRSAEIIGRIASGGSNAGTVVGRVTDLKKNQAGRFRIGSADVWVARTGYTGEDGFELVAPTANLLALWDLLLGAGKPFGLKPAGLGARDTLRTEMGYPLYGHELDETTTPLEAGLGFFVALDKGEFNGREIMAKQKSEGLGRKLVAFKMTDRSAPPRPGYPIWSTGPGAAPIGKAVSGTQSPSLNVGIGLGYVPVAFAKAQTPIEIEIRGKRSPALIVPKPLYQKPG